MFHITWPRGSGSWKIRHPWGFRSGPTTSRSATIRLNLSKPMILLIYFSSRSALSYTTTPSSNKKNDEAATSEAASTRTMALGDDPTVTVSIRAPNDLRHKGLYSSYESIYTWWVFVSTDAVLEEKACLWIGRPSGSMDGG